MPQTKSTSAPKNNRLFYLLLGIALVFVIFFAYRPIAVKKLNHEALELMVHGSSGDSHSACAHDSFDVHLIKSVQSKSKQAPFKKAVNKLERSLQWNPTDPETWMLKAEAYRCLNDSKKALASYQHCVKIAPKNIDYRASLAELYYHQKDFKKARLEFEKALDGAPNDIGCLRFLILICDQTNDRKSAVIYSERLIKLQKKDPVACEILAGKKFSNR
jgi:cytochrome c-type biogenesis protein CcmH/NrfG